MAVGYEIYDANGNVILDETDSTASILHVEYIPVGTVRTFSVPNFDSNNGIWFTRSELTMLNLDTRTYYDGIDDSNYTFYGYRWNGCDDFASIDVWWFPGGDESRTITWNNTTKEMYVDNSALAGTDINGTYMGGARFESFHVIFVGL